MSEFSRRSLLGGAVAAAAASTMWTEPVRAQYVWQKSDWHAAEFEALTHTARRVKLVVHGFAINDSRFLKNAKNSLTGLQFGSGIAADQIQVVCALNGPANMANYSDYVWQKYRIGEWIKVDDPKTGQPAVRNIFYPSKARTPLHYASEDPSNEDSAFQDFSVQGLQARIRRDTGFASRLIWEGIDILAGASGGSFASVSHPLNRIWHDARVASLHATLVPSTVFELYGRMICGLDAWG